LPGGPVTPVTPPGTVAIPGILPSGEVLARTADGSLAFYPAAGTGAPRPLVSKLPVAPDVEPLRVASTGRFMFVRQGSVPARIDRLDLTDGRQSPWMTLRPAESIPVAHIWTILLTPDGRGYAYTYGIYLQDLSLVDGLPRR